MKSVPRISAQDSGELLEKVVEQFTAELRAGRQPEVQQWVASYPQLPDDLSDMLSSVAMIEGLKDFSPATSQPQARFSEVEVPDYLGAYRIVGELGRGGMGIVLEAVHETLGRRVAIKIMAPTMVTNTTNLERFHREAIAAAGLHHTNIVNVFGAGEDQGFHFYVMEFIDGKSVNQILKQYHSANQQTAALSGRVVANAASTLEKTNSVQPNSYQVSDSANSSDLFEQSEDLELTVESIPSAIEACHSETTVLGANRYRWVAQTGVQLADALAYAHDKNILHRDIKPANLVLDPTNTVWLTDFGLAKSAFNRTDQTAVTKTGDILGTPQYMAPESFSGSYDERSETYCLGLTLYELATLQPAIANGSTPEVIRAVTTQTPVAPKKVDPSLPLDLATVIEKAISKEPHQRYQSAAELRDDLRAFVEDRPIAARRTSLLGQFIRFSRRNRLAASLIGLLVLTLGLLAVTAAAGYWATNNALTDLRAKQISLQQEEKATRAALSLADENARQIESQFQRAETNVDVALEAFDQVFRHLLSQGTGQTGDLDIDGFQQMAGIERVITIDDAEFVEKLLEFYQRLAVDSDHNRDFRTQSATASRRIANVYRLVGEAKKSTAAYDRAIETFEELASEQPESIDALLDAVETRNERSSLMGAMGNWRTALADLIISRDQLFDHALADDVAVKLQLVRTYNQLTSGPVRMMFAVNSENAQNLQDQHDESGADTDAHQNRSLFAGVDLLQPLRSGKLQRAPFGDMVQQVRQIALEAVEITEDLRGYQNATVEFGVVRAESLCNLALLEQILGGDARLPLEAAVDELTSLQQDAPDEPQLRYLLALTRSIASQLVSPRRATQLLQESQSTLKSLVSRYQKIHSYRQLYAGVCIELAQLQIVEGALNDARRNLAIAGELIVQLRADARGDLGTRLNRSKLFKQFKSLSDALAFNGEFEAAAEVEVELNRISRQLNR